MKRGWWWVLVPLVVGGLLGLAIAQGRFPNPTLYLRAEFSVLIQLCGVGLAILLAGWLVIQERIKASRRNGREEGKAKAAEERRRFLQRLDHEMKNPLTAIHAGLANLEQRPDPQTIESTRAQADRLNRLVVDLRKLAELETRPIEFAPVNLAELLTTLAEMTEPGCSEKGMKLTLNLPVAPWPLPKISGDEDLLLLAFHNLLDNAVKFSQMGDTIEVRAFEDGAMVAVEVADTGAGIPEDELPHVWEELFRGEMARGIAGSGMGLALVRVIIERHRGGISLRSRTGEGSVVTVRLPASHQ